MMAESPQSLFTSDKFRRSVVKTTNELIKIGACDTSVTVQFKLAEDCEMTDEVESAFLAIPMEGLLYFILVILLAGLNMVQLLTTVSR